MPRSPILQCKVFYKLVKQQRSVKNTSTTEVLHYKGQTFSSTEGVANAFSEHFKKLATPTDIVVFDKDYTNQVTFDKLLVESLASYQFRNYKSVTPK